MPWPTSADRAALPDAIENGYSTRPEGGAFEPRVLGQVGLAEPGPGPILALPGASTALVRGSPTTWTILQQDGPNHLGLRSVFLPGASNGTYHLGLCALQVLTGAASGALVPAGGGGERGRHSGFPCAPTAILPETDAVARPRTPPHNRTHASRVQEGPFVKLLRWGGNLSWPRMSYV